MKTKSFLTFLLLIFPCLMLKAQTWGLSRTLSEIINLRDLQNEIL